MNCPKVSIICPVYKAEKYLQRCLDSIQQQTLSDWECILVDDGSPDNSGAICDEYAAQDPRFKVIHQENGGVALARQTGVDAATGEYLIHADPDDYVELNMLEEMESEIERQGVDVLLADFFRDKANGSIVLDRQTFKGSTCKELVDDILFQRLHGSLWNKIVKRSCYITAAPQFFSGINYCEDVLIWVQMSRCNVSVGYLPKAYYHYVSTECSITNRMNLAGYEMRKRYLEKLLEFAVETSIVNRIAFPIKARAVSCGFISRKEYYSDFPASLVNVLDVRSPFYRLFGIFAYYRFFYIGRIILLLRKLIIGTVGKC